VKFIKMHGCGNDYVYLDAISEPSLAGLPDSKGWAGTVAAMSDRHTGIGSDGVILVCPPTAAARRRGAAVRMRMFNADGSESGMCGNGVRCVAKVANDRLGIAQNPMKVETGRGVLTIGYKLRRGKIQSATVDMGRPVLSPKAVPMDTRHAAFRGQGRHWGVQSGEVIVIGVPVSMGNPHLVVFDSPANATRDLSPAELRRLPLDYVGPMFEAHAAFPERVNLHFVACRSPGHIVMRSWERGSGITRACGTGACAAVVAGVLTERIGREVDVDLPGGRLKIAWDKVTGRVFMTGPAVEVFEGTWENA